MKDLHLFLNIVRSLYPTGEWRAYPMCPQDMVFEERVKLNCFYCPKYNVNWKCPPRIPALDYRQVLSEYEHCVLITLALPLIGQDFADVRVNSSLFLHKGLLALEKELWEHDNATAVSFIGGSCKLCKNGCGIEKCNNPAMARMSLEAAGINVVKTAAKVGCIVEFPPKESILRV
ncbi:MAG TPA: hypothetical protein DCY75_00305, partial [Clostridiales bacterium]|nr:hypothetical protein [Clostridiales bacterium]